MTARVSKMAVTLEALTRRAMTAHELAAEISGWTFDDASKALSNAKSLGYAQFAGPKVGRAATAYELTDLGRYRAGLTTEDPRATAAEGQPELAEKAAALILRTQGGMASDALAVALGCTAFEVESALAQHKKGVFVTCKVWRNGDDFIHYRESASVAHEANDWKRTRASAPAPAPRVQGPAVESDALQPPVQTVQPVPMPSDEEPPEAPGTEYAQAQAEPFFALYSTGELYIQTASDVQLSLTVEETRALFQWLDRLGGLNLQRLTDEAAVPA